MLTQKAALKWSGFKRPDLKAGLKAGFERPTWRPTCRLACWLAWRSLQTSFKSPTSSEILWVKIYFGSQRTTTITKTKLLLRPRTIVTHSQKYMCMAQHCRKAAETFCFMNCIELTKVPKVSKSKSKQINSVQDIWWSSQRYTYRVLQPIQMKLILLCVWAEPVILGSAKNALKFRYKKIFGCHV